MKSRSVLWLRILTKELKRDFVKDESRQTRSYLMKLFKDHGFNPRGDLGQNFLIDINLIEFAVRAAELTKNDTVLEVGPGTGGMTTFLAQEAGKVISVEIDRNMFALATKATEDCDNVTLINRDILKNKNTIAPDVTEFLHAELAARPGTELKLVANLPYSVATPVISNLVTSDLPWKKMVCTIQLELGEKMIAQPGSSGYGSLSVWLQSQCSVKIIRRLSPKVFWPRPKVNSAIVSLWRHDGRGDKIEDKTFFLDFLRRLFHHRRKRLRRVLVGMYSKQLTKTEIDDLIEAQGHNQETRAEELDVPTLVKLGNKVFHAVTGNADDSADAALGSELPLSDSDSAEVVVMEESSAENDDVNAEPKSEDE